MKHQAVDFTYKMINSDHHTMDGFVEHINGTAIAVHDRQDNAHVVSWEDVIEVKLITDEDEMQEIITEMLASRKTNTLTKYARQTVKALDGILEYAPETRESLADELSELIASMIEMDAEDAAFPFMRRIGLFLL